MGHLKWYKRDPRAALTGMMQLTLEERGAYNTILDLIYVHDGDDEVRDAKVRWLQALKAADKRWATYREIKALADGSAMLSTSTLRSLSAKVVPLKTTEK